MADTDPGADAHPAPRAGPPDALPPDVAAGRYLDARVGAANMAALQRELGYAKCALPGGIAVRPAVQLIIESIELQDRS